MSEDRSQPPPQATLNDLLPYLAAAGGAGGMVAAPVSPAMGQAALSAGSNILGSAFSPFYELGLMLQNAGQYTPQEMAQHMARPVLELGLGGMAMPKPPVNALGIFGGSRALTGPHELMDAATEMEFRGYSPDEIFKHTGWFRGADFEWRHTIPDAGARLRTEPLKRTDVIGQPSAYIGLSYGGKALRMEDILSHPRLFDAYPELKGTPVRPMPLPNIMEGTMGITDLPTQSIWLAPRKSEEELLSTLLHEAQHLVQGREHFARGGSSGEFLPKDFGHKMELADKELGEIEKEIDERGDITPYALRRALGIGEYDDPNWHALEKFSKTRPKVPGWVTQGFIDRYKSAIDHFNELRGIGAEAYNSYKNLAGEVEARAVQEQLAHRDWSRAPFQMEGYIPYENQILRFNEPNTARPENWLRNLQP